MSNASTDELQTLAAKNINLNLKTMTILSEILSAILQIFVFTLVPFLVFVIQKKSTKGFLHYIGLKRSTRRANYLAILACLLFVIPMLLLTLINPAFQDIMFAEDSITGKFREEGFSIAALFVLIVKAVFTTSLSEEIFFRGFLAKRLIHALGFRIGNILQALIFGIIHTIIFASITNNPIFLSVIFVGPALGAYISAYLNERLAEGSIIPGWISHGLANILSYGIVGFLM